MPSAQPPASSQVHVQFPATRETGLLPEKPRAGYRRADGPRSADEAALRTSDRYAFRRSKHASLCCDLFPSPDGRGAQSAIGTMMTRDVNTLYARFSWERPSNLRL